MKTKFLIQTGLAGITAVALLTLSLPAAETKPRRAATQVFMRQKLMWSQAALEGLALEKFDLVSRNALRMREMTRSNQWFAIKQPEYLVRTTNFVNSVDALYMAAVDRNLEAATEAYAKVSRNCVECHRLVRLDQRKNANGPSSARTTLEPDLKPVILP